MRLVVDCSIVVSWFLTDEQTDAKRRVWAHVEEHGIVVPSVWHSEVLNTLLVAVRRKRLASTSIATIVDALLKIETETVSPGFDLRVVALAQTHGLTLYDASYLGAAVSFGLPLCSLDVPLNKAAKAEGVVLWDLEN